MTARPYAHYTWRELDHQITELARHAEDAATCTFPAGVDKLPSGG